MIGSVKGKGYDEGSHLSTLHIRYEICRLLEVLSSREALCGEEVEWRLTERIYRIGETRSWIVQVDPRDGDKMRHIPVLDTDMKKHLRRGK